MLRWRATILCCEKRRGDLGRGEHHYKLRVATGSYLVAEGAVRDPEVLSAT